jgi:ribose/xylose/arabinose/galactoside ABC-type transport system permease subunit
LALSVLLLGTVQNAMGLANLDGSIQTLVIGLILALSIVLPVIGRQLGIMRTTLRVAAPAVSPAAADSDAAKVRGPLS